jgi:fructokinase
LIVVVGEILIDVFDNYQRIGGAPFNFAFHLKNLGWPVRFLSRIGNDEYGKTILDMVKKQGFNAHDIPIDDHHPTGTVQVSLDRLGVPQFDIRTDVAYDYIDVSIADSIEWSSVQMIYIGTLAQRTDDNFRRIQKIMAKMSPETKVFFDINLRLPHVNTIAVETSLEQTDILKLNTDEFLFIQNIFNGTETENRQIDWLMERFSIEMVVLTKGSDGSIIYTAKQTATASTQENTKVVDTVGAGDAYAAVSAAGYLNGLSPEAIVEKASDFAAFVCTLPGAIPDDVAVYKKLRQQLGGTTHV